MSTIKQALAQAGREIGEAVKDTLTQTRDRIRSDRAKIEALEEYVQSIFDIESKHDDLFEGGQQSVVAQVAQIIDYQPRYTKKDKS